jgi:hypothetical protein
MKYAPVALGICVTVYWILAFAVALSSPLNPEISGRPWWDLAVFRVPGLWVHYKLYFAFEQFGASSFGPWYHYFIGTLLITAIGIGSGCTLASQIVLSRVIAWRYRAKMKEQKSE